MIKTSGIGIIISEKKVLLCKRKSDKKVFPQCRDFPGGRSDDNEKPKQTAIREVKEETNLEFIPQKLFETQLFGKRTLYLYLWKRSGNIFIQAEEADWYGRFLYDEAISLPLAFEYKQTLSKLKDSNLIH